MRRRNRMQPKQDDMPLVTGNQPSPSLEEQLPTNWRSDDTGAPPWRTLHAQQLVDIHALHELARHCGHTKIKRRILYQGLIEATETKGGERITRTIISHVSKWKLIPMQQILQATRKPCLPGNCCNSPCAIKTIPNSQDLTPQQAQVDTWSPWAPSEQEHTEGLDTTCTNAKNLALHAYPWEDRDTVARHSVIAQRILRNNMISWRPWAPPAKPCLDAWPWHDSQTMAYHSAIALHILMHNMVDQCPWAPRTMFESKIAHAPTGKLPKPPQPGSSTGSGLHGRGKEGQLKGKGKSEWKPGNIASIRPHPFVQQWVANYRQWLCTPEVQESAQNIGLRPINPSLEGMMAHHDGIRMAREARVPAINPGRNILIANPAAHGVPLPAEMAIASNSTETFSGNGPTMASTNYEHQIPSRCLTLHIMGSLPGDH
jgi:hypothetical protein